MESSDATEHDCDALQVTRRAVFSKDLSVWAYELMGSARPDRSVGSDLGLLNAIAELGVKPLVGDHVAIVTVGRDTMLGRLPLPAGSSGGGLILDLKLRPEDIDEALIEAVDQRLDEGFQLAVSGAVCAPGAEPLVQRAGLLRIPFAGLRAGVLDNVATRPRGQSLWVDSVDQPEDFPNTRRYAPNYFSGDFLLKPSPVEGRRAPRNLAVLVELMHRLREPDVRFAEIEKILRKDAGLSVTLLRFLNSAGFGLRVQVSNIRQAVALLGLGEFSKWVTLVGLGEVSTKPNEVLMTALVRAKTCELMAQKNDSGGAAFMVGLFSLLDAMLNQPLEAVLEELPVSDVLRGALLDHSGFEGEILAAVLDHERGLPPEESPPGTADLYDSWRAAVCWAEGLRSSLGATASRSGSGSGTKSPKSSKGRR